MITAVIGIAAIVLITVGPVMSDVSTPNYEVVRSEGNIEVRQYDPMIVAEVKLDGERREAGRDGFRLLADYIFGNNVPRHDIAMTSPVQQQKSAKIAMTAPVQQQFTNDTWLVSFIMPAEYSMKTLPEPVDDRVSLKEIPTKQLVTVRFSGTSSDENVKEHEQKLIEYIKANNLSVIGSPKYAFYNPPWTLPSMRRNEVMFEIAE